MPLRLLCLVKRPLTPRDAERFGMIAALARGHAVRVIDVGRPSHPMLPADQRLDWLPPGLEVTVCDDWAALRRRADLFAWADLAMLFNQSFGLARNNLPVMRMIAAARLPYLLLAPTWYGATIPRFADQPAASWLGRLAGHLALIDPLNSLIARIPPGLLGIPKARFMVYNGLASMGRNSLVGDETRPIWAHAADCDIFRAESARRHPVEDQAVFLDQFLPHHPDIKAVKTATTIDPGHYYAALRTLFDQVEAQLGLKVVIAAHPRAEYPDNTPLLGGRPVVRGRTAEMVARSRLVLSHVSTALGLAVQFGRPILLIATRDHYALTPGHSLAFDQAARSLGTPLRFIEPGATHDLSGAMTVDRAAYDGYIHAYLSHPEAPDRLLWDIVLDAVEADLAAPGARA